MALPCKRRFFGLCHSRLTCKTSRLRMCAVAGRSSSAGVFGTRCSQHRGRRELLYRVLTCCLEVPADCSLGDYIVLTSCLHGACMVHTWCSHSAFWFLSRCLHCAYMVLTWYIHGAHIALSVLITWCLCGAYMVLISCLHGAYIAFPFRATHWVLPRPVTYTKQDSISA